MSTVKAYEEVVDFIAAGTSPDSVIRFHPSESAKDRVAELISREKPRACRQMKSQTCTCS